MRSKLAILAVLACVMGGFWSPAKAAVASPMAAAPSLTVAAPANPAIQKAYWAWVGGRRYWRPGYPGPRPGYGYRPGYRPGVVIGVPPYGGRYWHRRWAGGRWRYW